MTHEKKSRREPDKTAAEYYELKSDAVNELINANVTNTPQIDRKELKKYRRKSFLNMPEGLKYFLVKWWFAGVVCWFFMIGLGAYGIDIPDMILIMGVVTGLLWDLPVNIFIRLKAEKNEYGRYMMCPGTSLAAGFLNVLYGILLIFLTAMTYTGINLALRSGSMLGVGPILFGVFTAGWDLILLQGKKLGSRILADAKKNAAQGGRKK